VTYVLTPHPDFLPRAVQGVEVDLFRCEGNGLVLTYRVRGAVPSLPERAAPRRADGLWQTTCFELFLRPQESEGYVELNFAPSTQWAAYAFDSYRDGMRNLALRAEPTVEVAEPEHGAVFGLAVHVDLPELGDVPLQASITAVIEESDGAKSYWALAHPAGKPDFHDGACFVLELPAAVRA
jgi:hypothetical protein